MTWSRLSPLSPDRGPGLRPSLCCPLPSSLPRNLRPHFTSLGTGQSSELAGLPSHPHCHSWDFLWGVHMTHGLYGPPWEGLWLHYSRGTPSAVGLQGCPLAPHPSLLVVASTQRLKSMQEAKACSLSLMCGTSLVSHSDTAATRRGCWAGLGLPASLFPPRGADQGHVLTLLPQWLPLGEPRQASGKNSPRRQAETWAGSPTAWLAARTRPQCRWNSDRPKQKVGVDG